MDYPLYLLARGVLLLLQALPLRWVARLGRGGGALAYTLDRRHRAVAQNNLSASISPQGIQGSVPQIALENFKRIGENFACAVKTSIMSEEALSKICEIHGAELLWEGREGVTAANDKWIVAIGHFGNFELYARVGRWFRWLTPMTTYRGLPSPALNRLLRDLRERSGCLFFERRSEAAALKAALNKPGVLLGLLCDQHAGDHGLRLPFLGRECSTSTAPAVLALRYHCRLTTAICQRSRLGHWRFVVGEEIPTYVDGRARAPEAIMLDINRTFEREIRRDPCNWFWVHRRWKPPPRRQPKAALAAPGQVT